MFRVTILLRRARLASIFFSIMAMVLYFAASNKMISVTSYGTSWLALLVQIAVCLFQLYAIPWLMGMPLPQDIEGCVLFLLIDWATASFTLGMDCSLIWIAVYMMPVSHVPISVCSLAYGCMVVTAGIFAEMGFLFDMLLAMKLRTPAQQ